MKVYTKIVFDKNGNTIEEESFEYDGVISACGGGSKSSENIDYAYNDRMASLSEEQQGWAREYFDVWQGYHKPYEIAQTQANMENLPLENSLYRSQLNAASELLPQQTEAAKKFLTSANEGVDVNERMALATADTANAWKDTTASTVRESARMGINPNSGRYQGIQAAMGTQKASQMAGTRTQSRVGAEQENYERLRDAASFNPTGGILQGLGALK